MSKKIDATYVVAAKLGSIGMGSTAYYAITGIEKSGLFYKGFCRGYKKNISLNKNNLSNYGFLEYLSYPFRFLEKKIRIKINSFRFVNFLFGKLVYWNLPESRIYHTWMGVAFDAVTKAKKNGSIMIIEGANSHPSNTLKILNKEYKKRGMLDQIVNPEEIKNQVKIIEQFDYVMCPSDFVYDSFLEAGFSKDKLFKIPYGVDLQKFKIVKKTHKKVRFIFVGSIQIRKGVQYLLKAWDELKLNNAELIIVGRVYSDAKNIVNKYKRHESINFIGFDTNPNKHLKSSDIFISPSLEEGSALTCYEAMASGLPLIATYNTGSVIRDKKDGFIIPAGNTNILKEKILYFYNNFEAVKKMGINARKRIEKFSWESYGRNLTKIYKKILNEKK